MVLRGIGVQVAAWPGISCNVAAPTQGSIHPTRTRHNQASAAKEKKKRWLLVAMTTGRQRLHGTKDGRSRLCDWERESKWCVAEQARPSWGPYSFVSCWDHRSPDAAEIEEEEGGVVVGGKERGGMGGGKWKRQLMWKERIKMMPGKVKSEAKNFE